MIAIKTSLHLKKALFSHDTGTFKVPVTAFIENHDFIQIAFEDSYISTFSLDQHFRNSDHSDFVYHFTIDDSHVIEFFIRKKMIVRKYFLYLDTLTNAWCFDRESDPAVLIYFFNGRKSNFYWYDNGVKRNKNTFGPISVSFDYTINDESYKRAATMINAYFCYDMCNYDLNNNATPKYLNIKRINFDTYSIPNAFFYTVALGEREYLDRDFKKRYPEIADNFNAITFDDCFDLGKNIFNESVIEMAEMVDFN